MFDAITSSILTSAPSLPELNSNQIPQLLTRHYAELVSARLRGTDEEAASSEERWSLERIADAYEIVASIEEAPALRRAAAFVAGTAQQIIARKRTASQDGLPNPLLDRDSVDASVAAGLLFLAAEQTPMPTRLAQRFHKAGASMKSGSSEITSEISCVAAWIRYFSAPNVGGAVHSNQAAFRTAHSVLLLPPFPKASSCSQQT